jgi:hypothetical protein
MLRGPVREERRNRDLDKGVEGIPNQVKNRNLVGKEFESEKHGADNDHRP